MGERLTSDCSPAPGSKGGTVVDVSPGVVGGGKAGQVSMVGRIQRSGSAGCCSV